VRKISLLLLIAASVALYVWWGGEDAPDSGDQPPTASSRPSSTAGVAVSPIPPKTRPQWRPRTEPYSEYTHGGYHAYAPQQIQVPEPAPTQAYRFRPLSPSEKKKLEQESVGDRLMAPPVQDLSGVAVAPRYGAGASTRDSDSWYAADDYRSPAFPGSAYTAPHDIQTPPTPRYRFREFDPDEAARRWTGPYPPTPRSVPPAPQERSSPWPPGWSPSLPFQRGTIPADNPLWAAEG